MNKIVNSFGCYYCPAGMKSIAYGLLRLSHNKA